jgi:hypothetical protein
VSTVHGFSETDEIRASRSSCVWPDLTGGVSRTPVQDHKGTDDVEYILESTMTVKGSHASYSTQSQSAWNL